LVNVALVKVHDHLVQNVRNVGVPLNRVVHKRKLMLVSYVFSESPINYSYNMRSLISCISLSLYSVIGAF
jgi:hypothetical protein